MKKNVLQDWLLLTGYSALASGAQKCKRKTPDNHQTDSIDKQKWWEYDSQGIGMCKHLKGYHKRMKGMVLCRRCGGLRRCYGQKGCKQYEKAEG